MKFLVVGAGAIGGYFGGRLVAKGEDVTFLVRERRKKTLAENGLSIRSMHGDVKTKVKAITSQEALNEEYDVIILSVKAYHLAQTISDITPLVRDNTVILPLLNGYEHFNQLSSSFGAEKVLGGLCFIESTLNEAGEIIQTSERHDLVFGEWDGRITNRVEMIYQHMKDAGFALQLSDEIQQQVWHKYIFISTLSGITTLMRNPIGPILLVQQANELIKRLIAEIVSIARLEEAPLPPNIEESTYKTIESLHYQMKSSMQRDMEKGLPVEADHLHGSLLEIGKRNGILADQLPILNMIYANLKVYEESLRNS